VLNVCVFVCFPFPKILSWMYGEQRMPHPLFVHSHPLLLYTNTTFLCGNFITALHQCYNHALILSNPITKSTFKGNFFLVLKLPPYMHG